MQNQLSKILNAFEDSVIGWKLGQTNPLVKQVLQIESMLGYKVIF